MHHNGTVPDGHASVKTHMHFLAEDPLFETEKPYSLRFPPDGDLPQTNIKRERHEVTLHSLRNVPNTGIEQRGFEIVDFPSQMSYDDFADEATVRSKYLPEVRTALIKTLGARHVHVLDFAVIDNPVRRRDAGFPISTGEEFKFEQPTALVHIDFTVQEGERLLRILYGDTAEQILSARWQIINVWKPLRGPLNDWPLGLCDASTVDYSADTMASDVVYDDFAAENLQVHYRQHQKWYYLPDQTASEAFVFKSADSEDCISKGFFNPNVKAGEAPRESIDLRAFVLYADLTEYPPTHNARFEA